MRDPNEKKEKTDLIGNLADREHDNASNVYDSDDYEPTIEYYEEMYSNDW